jgi:hypothetical protein
VTEVLPPEDDPENESEKEWTPNILAINNLHYHANFVSEVTKLAAIDPALAAKIIEQRDRENDRANASYKLGLVTTLVLLSMILTSFSALIIFAGILPTLISIGAILASSVFIRVVLTGEWSDTSWFGKLIGLVVKALGGSPTKE